ncbi:putative 2-dehydropantoate 2-reductase [Phlyctema vagabunda]|uniref:2-dehydropantoate 2-reductase n=1 Tax=Phlyctema vagabunda TaxID=108571 RepID=A0ABR4PPJ0_9HELO
MQLYRHRGLTLFRRNRAYIRSGYSLHPHPTFSSQRVPRQDCEKIAAPSHHHDKIRPLSSLTQHPPQINQQTAKEYPYSMGSGTRPKVCLVGSGGVGTIASVVLEKAGAHVTAVLRSKYRVIKEKGWDIESVDHGEIKGWRPNRVVNVVSDAANEGGEPVHFDFVVVCMKQLPDLYSITDIISPVVSPQVTAIVLIQNGIDIEQPIIESFPTNTVMSSVSVIGSKTVGENTVIQIGRDIQTIGPHFHACGGRSNEDQLRKTKEFVDLYNLGLKDAPTEALVTLTEDMPAARWHKVLWNGTFNTVCAVMRMNVGEICASAGRERLLIPMMYEIWNVAKASGIHLPESDIRSQANRVATNSIFRPSMLIDVDYGRPMELEVILGSVLRRAENTSTSTPIINTIYELLRMRKWEMETAAVQPKASEGTTS